MSKKKIKAKSKKIFFIIIILIVLIFVCVKKKDKNQIPDKITVILQNQDVTSNFENDVVKLGNVIYMSFQDIKNFIDNTIYQENDGEIITTSDKKVALVSLDNNELIINGSKIQINGKPYKNQNDIIYLPISEMENVYDIEFNYTDETKIATIDYYTQELKKADTKKKISVKKEPKSFSATLEKIPKESTVVYISEDNGWAQVRTPGGIIGYVKSKKLTNIRTERENMEDILTENEDIKYLEVDISNESLSTYKKREKLINKILLDAVKKEYLGVKLICKNKEEKIERFKLEATPIFKECGISVIYN